MLQRLMGRNWVGEVGLLHLGTRAIKVLFMHYGDVLH